MACPIIWTLDTFCKIIQFMFGHKKCSLQFNLFLRICRERLLNLLFHHPIIFLFGSSSIMNKGCKGKLEVNYCLFEFKIGLLMLYACFSWAVHAAINVWICCLLLQMPPQAVGERQCQALIQMLLPAFSYSEKSRVLKKICLISPV